MELSSWFERKNFLSTNLELWFNDVWYYFDLEMTISYTAEGYKICPFVYTTVQFSGHTFTNSDVIMWTTKPLVGTNKNVQLLFFGGGSS
jgi:hypothetical protein